MLGCLDPALLTHLETLVDVADVDRFQLELLCTAFVHPASLDDGRCVVLRSLVCYADRVSQVLLQSRVCGEHDLIISRQVIDVGLVLLGLSY